MKRSCLRYVTSICMLSFFASLQGLSSFSCAHSRALSPHEEGKLYVSDHLSLGLDLSLTPKAVTHEIVLEQDRKLSQLNWRAEDVFFLGMHLNYQITDALFLQGHIWSKIKEGKALIDDSDWENSNNAQQKTAYSISHALLKKAKAMMYPFSIASIAMSLVDFMKKRMPCPYG